MLIHQKQHKMYEFNFRTLIFIFFVFVLLIDTNYVTVSVMRTRNSMSYYLRRATLIVVLFSNVFQTSSTVYHM